jgi:hypothetical protein
MTQLSPSDLNYEIAGSKKCLADHGINATVIATIHGIGGNNGTLIDEIGKYYDLAVNGFDKLMPLHCTTYSQYSNQTDCRTYFTNGTLIANLYGISVQYSHDNNLITDYMSIMWGGSRSSGRYYCSNLVSLDL